MFVFISLLFRVLSYAVLVTGICGLLNYLFDWHLSIEGTEAPAEFDASVMLICFAITLAMWGEFAANNHYVVKFTKKWYAVASYLIISIMLSAVPIFIFIKADEDYDVLYEALVENDVKEFHNKENLRKLSQKNIDRLFSESIRRNSPEIALLTSKFLEDINGDKRTPYIFLAAYLCNPKIFEILIERKANFLVKEDYMGSTVAHSIVTGKGDTSDKIKMIRMLAEQNFINVDGIDKFHSTPLMNAVERGDYELVEALLALKADWRKVDHVGNPVLTRACEKSSSYPDVKEEARIRTVQVLLKNGVDKYVKDYLGRDCREMAERDGFTKLAELF